MSATILFTTVIIEVVFAIVQLQRMRACAAPRTVKTKVHRTKSVRWA
jgi:hypothetical protein